MASLAKTKSTTRKPKSRTARQVYGFIIEDDWIAKRAQADFGPSLTTTAAKSHAYGYILLKLLNESRLGGLAAPRCIMHHGHMKICIALAEGRSIAPPTLPPQASLNKLKQLLGTDKPARWYGY